jgi:hypothetical protein
MVVISADVINAVVAAALAESSVDLAKKEFQPKTPAGLHPCAACFVRMVFRRTGKDVTYVLAVNIL